MDLMILNFAVYAEELESTFYSQMLQDVAQNLQKWAQLSQDTVSKLRQTRDTEQEHVVLLQSALAQAGVTPFLPCQYNFDLSDPQKVLQTAVVLDNVGVSAYLGASPLVSDKNILGTAASILTIEARHQSVLREIAGLTPVPQAFDAALGPRFVSTLTQPFIASCADGANMAIMPFSQLQMAPGQEATAMSAGSTIRLQISGQGAETAQVGQGQMFCGFTSGGIIPGGTRYTPFTQANGCVIPQGLAGVTYVTLTKAANPMGMLTDEDAIAGPMAMVMS